MADPLLITITAKDGASTTFKVVGQSAASMGKQIDQAGDTAADAFAEIERSAARLEARYTKIGAGIGTVVGALSKVGQARQNEIRSIDAVNRLYGDSAERILDYADSIQDLGIASDDTARRSATVLATLNQNYGLTIDQIETLVMRSADLAELHARSFEEASQMVQNAIRGEAEYIEALGVTLNDTYVASQFAARGMGNWNTVTDEAVKAQFRYQLLLEQTATAQGYAAERADSARGAVRALGFEFQDLTQHIGAVLGPIAGVASELAPLALYAPIVGAGLGKLAAGMRQSAAGAAVLRTATAGLGTVFSPLGLAITGVVAAGVNLYSFYRNAKQQAEETAEAIGVLVDEVERLKLAQEGGLAAELQGLIDYLNEFKDLTGATREELVDFLNLPADTTLTAILGGPLRGELDASMGKLDDFVNHITEVYNSLTSPAAKDAYIQYVRDMLDGVQSTVEGTNLDEILDEVISKPASEIPGVMDAVADSTDNATASLGTFKSTLTGVASGAEALLSVFGSTVPGIQSSSEKLESIAEQQKQAAEEQRRLAEELQKAREEWIASALAVGGFDDALSQLNMAGAASDVSLFAESWQDANAALDSTFRVIVGNTNAIIQQVDGIQSWADSLINVRGELGAIDELLEQRFIDRAIYDDAQDAYDRISVSVRNIRNNLLAVQAIQAPFIAEAVAGTERWAQQLRDMPADVQRTTLAFMDLETVQTAQELVTLANAEAFGTMGETGRTAFEAMIQGAAQTNPMLLDVLDTMGYITRAGDEFTINWDAIAAGGDAISQLTTQVGYLVDTLREVYGLPPLSIDVDTSSVDDAARTVDFLYERVAQADGQEAYLIVRVDEAGAQTIDRIVDSVDNLDGTYTVTVEAQTGETYDAVVGYDGKVISTTYVDVVPRLTAAGAGGMTAGALTDIAGRLGIPETIDTTVTVTGAADVTAVADAVATLSDTTVTVGVDVTGWETIGSLYDILRDLDDPRTVTVAVDADTSGIDGALLAYGLGGGDGSGGGARFEAPSMTIDVEADTSGIDAALAVYSPEGTGGVLLPGITVPVTADTSTADADLAALATTAGSVPSTISVSAIALTDGAMHAIAGVDSALVELDGSAAGIRIDAANYGSPAIEDVDTKLNALDGDSATVTIDVVNHASATIAGVSAALWSLDGRTATSYIDTIHRNYTVNYAGPGGRMHGGIPGYAMGGVTARMGEAGPELLHFAGGGTAWAPVDALYTVPEMTYVSPANAGRATGGDAHFHFHFEGPTYGVDDLTTRVLREAGPAIAMAVREERRSLGGMS